MTPESSIVPNTLSLALQPCDQKRIIVHTQDSANFQVVYINEAFTKFAVIDQMEARNKPLLEIAGITKEEMRNSGLQVVLENACNGRAGSCIIGSNERLNLIYFKALPLSSDSTKRITHVLLVCF